MIEIASVAVTVVLGLLAGVVWLVRLEGRLNVVDAKQAGTDKRVDGIEERIFDELRTIRQRLDTLAER